MGWQKRVEKAQDRRKQQKNKKLRKEQRSIHKALVHNELWPLLARFKDINPNLPPGKLHLWVDTVPGPPRQEQPSTVDEIDDFDSPPTTFSTKNNKKKGKSKSNSKGESNPQSKKQHPRSHDASDDDGADDDEPLLCHEFFFTGKCQGLNKGGGKSKKCVPQCHLFHPPKNQLTLAAALEGKSSKGSNLAIQTDTLVQDTLNYASSSALATQKKLDGDEILEDDSNVLSLSKSAGIDMLYHIEVPLLVEGGANTITGLVTNLLAREKVATSSIAYVVYENVLIFDRCDGCKVISIESQAMIFGTNNGIAKETARSDSFITFPSTVLEHILIYLPGKYSGLLPMVCKSLHSEIGTHSPALWRELLLRQGWTEPKNVQPDPTTLYKSFFISHDRICQRVEALKMGVTKLLKPDNDVEVSRGTALGALNEYQDDLGSTEMYLWDDHSVLIASQNDCVVHLHQVSTKTSSDDKRLREIMQVRLAPVPISKKIDCTLTELAIDDRYVLFAFDVDGRSILASIMKDELLSNSTEDTIECGDCLKKHELSLMVKDACDRNPDYNDLRFLSDLLIERQSFENDLIFNVLDLKEVGHGIFCVLVNICNRCLDLDEEEIGIVLLSFSASNGREAILDCVRIPAPIHHLNSPMLSSNMEWRHRSDPVEIVCTASTCYDRYVTNVDRSGVFHPKPFTPIPRLRTRFPTYVPTYSSHTVRTPSRLVKYSKSGGAFVVYEVEDDLLPENLPLKAEFHTVLSMNHLGNDYVMILCRRDAIPADEEIDSHWFGNNYSPQSNVYCLHFIVIHIPSMEEIYVSRITSIEKVDMMVAIGKDCTIVAAVQGKGFCFSSPHVVSLNSFDHPDNNEFAPRQKKVKKKKRNGARKIENDTFKKKFSSKNAGG
jgi:hypothetical protein